LQLQEGKTTFLVLASTFLVVMARAAEKRRRQKEKKQKLVEDVERVLRNKSPKEQISALPDEKLFFIDEKPLGQKEKEKEKEKEKSFRMQQARRRRRRK